MLAAEERLISVEDYLEGEHLSEVRHEYVAGRVFAMAGATEAHNRISLNLAFHLRAATRGQDCGVFMNDMKVAAPIGAAYYYPDVVLSCEGYDAEATIKLAPCLIAEVLSPSTQLIDRREKLLGYRQLASLRHYLIIAQDQALVEHWWRDPVQGWVQQCLSAPDARIPIDCPPVVCELRLADLYEDVRFADLADSATPES
jgi:Uma2 family endonuclease